MRAVLLSTVFTHSMVNWSATHCYCSAASRIQRDCRPEEYQLHLPHLQRGQCRTRKWNGGCTGEESQGRSRAKQRNKAKLEQDWEDPTAGKAKKLWEAILLQPGSAEALQRRPCSKKSSKCSAMHEWKAALPSHSLGQELQVRLAASLIFPSSQIWAVPVLPCCVNRLRKKTHSTGAPWGNLKKITVESPLQFTQSFCAALCPCPIQKGMLYFSVCRNCFSKPWTGLASHWGCLSCSSTPPAVCYHTYSCTGRPSLIHFQQNPTSLVKEVRPQAGAFFQI